MCFATIAAQKAHPQAAAEQQGVDRGIPLANQRRAVERIVDGLHLFGAQPVPHAHATTGEPLYPRNPPRRRIVEHPALAGVLSQPAHGSQP
jgi:hypothetical protein